MEKPVLPTATAADQLIDQDKTTGETIEARKWGAPLLGTGAVVTYSFLGTAALADRNGDGTEHRLTVAEMGRMTAVLRLIEDVADVDLVRKGKGWSDAGQITIQKRDAGIGNTVASFFVEPDTPDRFSTAVVTLGRITDGATAADWFSQRHAIHEILHGLGLTHPSDYDGAERSVSYAEDAAFFQDSTQYTVMSYFAGSETGASYARPADATLMLLDVMALQNLYGANDHAFAGDTVYGFGSNTRRTPWTLHDTEDVIYGAIWDTGGIDTIDLSGFALPSRVFLRPERFSSMNGETDTMVVPRGVRIENATGGAGDDTLAGNGAANRLTGYGGGNVVNGRAGADTLLGGAGSDRLSGGRHDDLIRAGAGTDRLDGGSGKDRLMGQHGADTLAGGGGADVLIGGGGADTFRFLAQRDSRPCAPDRIGATGTRAAFEHGADVIDLSQIDAIAGQPGNQAFVLDGTGAGRLKLTQRDGLVVIALHRDTDDRADMLIEVAVQSGALTNWSATDFLL